MKNKTVKLLGPHQIGHELLMLKGARRLPSSRVSFSPDGSCSASASADSTVKLWDTGTGLEILTLKGHSDGITGVSFSPDGSRIASAS